MGLSSSSPPYASCHVTAVAWRRNTLSCRCHSRTACAPPVASHARPGPLVSHASPLTPGLCPWRQVAVAYAQRAQLDRGAHAPTHILLDTALCDALFKVLKP